MVEVAFKSIDNYFEFFKDVDEVYKSKEKTLKSIISELESKYADLLNDKPKKQDEFLIPEIPKFKKEVKDKRESSRASRRNPSELSKVNTTQKDLFNSNDSEIIRRSSRIASKSKLKPSNVIPQNGKSENGVQDCTYIVSPSHPPTKIRRTSDIEQKRNEDNRSALEESVCTADMKQPLGASTPTSPPSTTPKADRKSTDMAAKKTNSDEENKTPTSDAARGAKIESVKKRIEEFEKRAKGHLLPSKLPIKSPDKSKLISLVKNTSSNVSNTKKEVFTEDESSISEARVLRANTKVLQEKNANVKISKEKALEAQKKKAAMIRASTEEKQRKREERGRKVAAQREAAEKEKQLAAMKSEKEKEQKLKQIQKLKDEKYKEEYLKKKQLAAMKAAEMEERRKQEEAARLAKLKKTQLAMNQAAAKEEIPQYGIDNVLEGDSSEDEDNPKKQIPSWATKKNREYPLNVQGWLNKKETVYPWFFNKNLKYPQLEELFSIEVKSRPRTSSAFWNSRICFNESFPLM